VQSQLINVLMTGAGAPGAAGILQCLWQDPSLNITVADADPDATGKYLANDFIEIPAGDSTDFIEFMTGICRQKNIHVVLPLVTKELLPFSHNTELFEATGTKIIISSPTALKIANNKSRLYEFLHAKGLPLPAFKVVRTVEEFEKAMNELNYSSRPICFKPSESNGSRGFRIVTDSIDESDLLFRHKPDSTYITPDNARRILSLKPFPELLVSEYLPGEEYSVDCLADHGEMLVAIPRLRKKIINGISVKGSFIEDLEVIGYCKKIISLLTLHGNIGIQFKANRQGQFFPIEINPRVQGTTSAALGTGVNLPLLAIRQELKLPILPEELQVKWGVHFGRYWREVFY
jgi:carbamoyl-phosphate synthase large subunit